MLKVLSDRLEEPTSRGLAHAVSNAIRDDALAPGERLPPIRTVASQLGLSPTTVSAAWSLLARAGTIRTDGRRGTTVLGPSIAGPTRYRRALDRQTSFELDLSTGVPDPGLLPDLASALRRLPSADTPRSYLDDPVLPALAEILRADWPYAAERITVLDGAMDAQDQAASSVLRFGDRVGVEHPCFPQLLDLLESLGVQPIGVAIDDDGMRAPELRSALSRGITALFLQPRAQNPTGASLTAERAGELSSLLSGTGVIVIEDDSAGAVATTPAISLGSWLPEQTIHIRSYSKSHGPDLRLAAMSGPAALIDPITERRFLGQGWTSRLLQRVLVDLLTHEPSLRAVERARAIYAERRHAVISGLERRGITVVGREGLNIWLPVRDETAALVRLASRGIGAASGGPFAANPGSEPHLRITVGLVTNRHDEIAAELADAATVGTWTSPR